MERSIKKALFAATVALSSLALGVLPAVASSLSAGTSTGEFNDYGTKDVGLAGPQCAENRNPAKLSLANTELDGALGDTTATVTIAAGALHFNPAGTFSDDACLIPGPVPAKLTVAFADGSTCTVEALYGRQGEAAEVITTELCSGHIWEFQGSQQPCVPGAPFDPCAIVPEWVGTYEAIPA